MHKNTSTPQKILSASERQNVNNFRSFINEQIVKNNREYQQNIINIGDEGEIAVREVLDRLKRDGLILFSYSEVTERQSASDRKPFKPRGGARTDHIVQMLDRSAVFIETKKEDGIIHLSDSDDCERFDLSGNPKERFKRKDGTVDNRSPNSQLNGYIQAEKGLFFKEIGDEFPDYVSLVVNVGKMTTCPGHNARTYGIKTIAIEELYDTIARISNGCPSSIS